MSTQNPKVLGVHIIKAPSQIPQQIHEIFKNVDIVYPDPSTKTTNKIQMKTYYQGLTDDRCYWNIRERISERNGGQLLLSPPTLQIIKDKVGSIQVARQRAADSNLSPEKLRLYKNWIKAVNPYHTENDIYLAVLNSLSHETGTLFQGFINQEYAVILTSTLKQSLNNCIETGLCGRWTAMAQWKCIDLNDVKFGHDKVSFIEFRKVLKKNEGDRNALMKNKIFKSHQTVLKKCADILNEHIAAKTSSKTYSEKLDDLQNEQLLNAYKIAHIRNEGREVDLFCILPGRKTILHIEVKSNKDLSGAKKQLSSMKKWVEEVHGDLFDGWNYICVAALPSIAASQFTTQVFINLLHE